MKRETEGEKKQVRRRRRLPEDTPKKAKKNNKSNPDLTNRHDRKKQQRSKTISIVILCTEVLVFCGVLYGLIHFSLKLKNGDFQVEGADAKQTAAAAEGTEEGASAGSVNVDNEKFSLTCTKVQLTTDAEGNPAALIFFTFVNKTSVPLSLGEVFPPKVVQDGIDCETFAALETPPDELYNKDMQIQDGASIEACYSVKLQNTTSELVLTVHDNYDTFTDIGSTVIPLS